MIRHRSPRYWLGMLLTVLMVILMVICVAITAKLWIEVEQMTRGSKAEQDSGPVYYAGAILPTNFDVEAYGVAYQRYDIENGLVIPDYISMEVDYHAER